MNIEEPTNQFLDSIPKIRVIIRKRPLGKKELQKGDTNIVDIRGTQTAVVRETKVKVDLTKYIEEHAFNFDRAYEENSTNQQIYMETMRPLVECLFNKAKVTCFAYGQTGSGKTFTMMGDSGSDNRENMVPGLYLLAAQDMFTLLEQPAYQHLGLYVSFYEIYCSKLHDLLNDRQVLHAREDAKQNVNIVGLSEKRILNVHSLMQIIDFGNSVRTTASTSANLDSSRSHAILQISLKAGNKLHGKMSFIDLAGSERGADVVDTNKQTRMDGAEINKSLLALKECIRALDQDKKHTPFRGSKLTLVLKDSFTGNCKTLMIGNISPSSNACEHTLNTLRYADRVKELKKPGDDREPLSQMDLLAKQLMLPRQNKNSTKFAVKKDEDSPNEDAEDFLAGIKKGGKTTSSSKQAPSVNQFPQGNKLGAQLLMGNKPQKPMSFPAAMGGAYMRPEEDLFGNAYSQAPNNEVRSMKDILNMQRKLPQMQNDMFNKQNNNNMQYQAAMYQNNNILSQQGFQHNAPQPYVDKENIMNNGQDNYMQNGFFGNNQPMMMQGFNNNMQQNQYQNPFNQQKENNNNMKARTHEDLVLLHQRHQELINLILSEEEEVLGLHRQHIDDIVDCTKQEMGLLHEVEKPGSDIDEYVNSFDAILQQKTDLINQIRGRLLRFREYLKEEEVLSLKLNEQKQEMMDIFDLNTDEQFRSDDIQLLDDLHQVM